MSRACVLALALIFPADVDHLDAFIDNDGAVHISWSLPADPTVVGLTIFRDNLDNGDTTIFVIEGLTTVFVDTSGSHDDDFRYWVHTRDAQGNLSSGVFVEVFDDHDHDHSSWTCVSNTTIVEGVSPWLGVLGASLLVLAVRRGR